jgi:single-strand DNA-binding protein
MAASLNKVFLLGNLTRDPEVKYTPKGTAVCDLGLAINDSYKAQDGTIKETVTFVDVEVWGRTAENCKQYLSKGRPVFIEGQLRLDQWEQDGQKRSKMKVRAMSVQFLGGGAGGNREGGGGERRASTGGETERPAARPAATVSEDRPPMPDDDDIPF